MRDHVQISAVVPTYNRAQLIRRAIDSALSQIHVPTEIIVVDDGSTDNTRAVVESYGQTVRYVYQANSGASAARNLGVREAKCEWIAFLDSDDYWLPTHLSRIATAISDTQGAGALYFSDIRWPEVEGGYYHWRACKFEIEGPWEFTMDAGKWAFMPRQPMMTPASVLSRHAYIKVGGLPQHLRTKEDTFLFYKLGVLYPACAVSGCGAVINYDDSIRLTQVYHYRSPVFLDASIFLFQELLESLDDISATQRQQLTGGLTEAHYAKGRALIRRKKYYHALKEMVTACRISPSRFLTEVRGSMERHLFATRQA
jgi:glycosyltransferase involved in cell wall biosynthesis